MATDILIRKQFIIANQPHIVTPPAASIQDFETDLVAPFKECKVYFEPIQGGSGDASPENVRNISGRTGFKIIRCGENLFNLNESDMIIDGWNRFFPNPMKAPGEYTISCEQQFGGTGTKGSAIFFVNQAINSAEHIGQEAIGHNFGSTVFSGNTIITEEQANASYILFSMSSSGCTFESLESAKIQIQLGSTATEYEAYNGEIIPVVLSKNLFDEVYEGISATLIYRSIYVGDNTVTASTTTPRYYTGTTGYSNLFILPGQVTSGAGTGTNDIYTDITRTVTPIDGYITIAYRNNRGVDPRNYHTQIEFGSIATAYEPYRTLYGGYIDLLTGEVWKTWDIVSSSVLSDWLLNRTSLLYESGKAIRCYCPENGAGSAIKWTVQCTHFSDVGPVGNWAKDAERKDGYVVEAQGRSIMFIASDLGFTTKQEWAQWMVDNNVQYVYPLAAPVLITTLTPTQIKTLRGTNNIYSTANGNIDIKYWTH